MPNNNKIIEKLLEVEASIDRAKCVLVFGEHTGNVFFDKIRLGGLLSAYGYLGVSNRKKFRVFFLQAEYFTF